VILSDEDLAALATAAQAPPSAPAPTHVAPAAPPAPVAPVANAYKVSQLVRFTWSDEYDGEQTRDAIVTELVPDTGDGTGPKVTLSLLAPRTGNIPESQISAV